MKRLRLLLIALLLNSVALARIRQLSRTGHYSKTGNLLIAIVKKIIGKMIPPLQTIAVSPR